MSEVERVARLLYAEVLKIGYVHQPWERVDLAIKGVYLAMARAVVADQAAALEKYEARHVGDCPLQAWQARFFRNPTPPECTCGLAARLAG